MLSTGSLSAFTASATTSASAGRLGAGTRLLQPVRQVGDVTLTPFARPAAAARPAATAAPSPDSRKLPRGSLLDLSV